MSGTPRGFPWTVRLSVWMYRRLLVAYPPAFRREYGAQMVQVFRDCCREAAFANRAVALWRFWLLAFGDLLVSAIAERYREEWHVTHMRLIWLGSLAAIVGGVIATLFAGLDLIVNIAFLFDVQIQVWSPLTTFAGLSERTGAATWLLLVLALVGLQVRGARRAGTLGWVSIFIALVGAFACAPNYIIVPLYLDIGSRSGTVLFGTAILAIGMMFYGIATLWQRTLPRHNWAPLTIGITELLKVATLFVAPLFQASGDSASLFRFMAMYNTIALAFAIAWILLGFALRPRGDGDLPAQAVTIEPAI